jgi:hypothetical protein
MRSTKALLSVCAAAMLALSCSPLSQLAGNVADKVVSGAGFTAVDHLWSDVPQMDGMTATNMDIPVYVKLYVQTALKAASGGEGGVDWIGFTTEKSPTDVQAYYTMDRMSSQGWNSETGAPCFSGSDQGISEVGAICIFTKQEASQQAVVTILATSDKSTNKTNVFFLRVTAQTTPTPGG